jgi:hypothetical protein
MDGGRWQGSTSGATRASARSAPSDNLVAFCKGVDVFIGIGDTPARD